MNKDGIMKLIEEQLQNDDELIKTLHELADNQHDMIVFLMHNLIEAYEALKERDDAFLKLDVLDEESLSRILEEKEIINDTLYELKSNLK